MLPGLRKKETLGVKKMIFGDSVIGRVPDILYLEAGICFFGNLNSPIYALSSIQNDITPKTER